MSQLEPTRSLRHFGRLFATPTLAHAQTFDRCVVPRALSLFPWLWVGPGDEVGGMRFEGSFQAINVGVTVGVRDSRPQNP